MNETAGNKIDYDAMLSFDKLKEALERLASGCGSKEDERFILEMMQARQLAMATGAHAVTVGGDVTDSVFVVGNQNIVFRGTDATTIRAALAAYFTPGPGSAPPVPDLVIGREEALGALKERLGVGKDDPGEMQSLAKRRSATKPWPGMP